MGTLILHDVDDKVLEYLSGVAGIKGQSLEQHAREILTNASQLKRSQLLAELEQCRALTPGPLSQASETIIRNIRDEH